MNRLALLASALCIAAWTASGCAPAPPPVENQGGRTPGLKGGPDGRVGKLEALELARVEALAAKELEIEAMLQTRLPKVEFKNTKLADVFDWFRKNTALEVIPRWRVLEAAGITQSILVKDIQLSDTTAEAALRVVLDDVGGTTPLGWNASQGYLVISTQDDLSSPRYRVTLIYDIRDLVPPLSKKTVIHHEWPAGQEKAGSEDEIIYDRTQVVNELCHIIARTVDKDSWMDPYGTGTVATMYEYGGLLIIEQTWENHKKIAALLADIRRHKPDIK